MFESVCSLPLSGDVFAQAVHPTEPLVAVGLFNGRVKCFRLPPTTGGGSSVSEDDAETSILSDGRATIDTIWETKRHKRSCRALTYSPDGDFMFSAGSDGIVKHFSSSSGRVASKVLVPKFANQEDAPSILHAIDPQHILLGTDAGALHIFDLRQDGLAGKAARTSFPHTDYISSIVPLPPKAATEKGGGGDGASVFPKQWVTTGGTTLAVTDIRSGTLVRSDDQEDDLLVLTMWDRGSWDDQQERVIVDTGRGGGDSIDAVALIPEEAGYGKKLFAAVGDGSLRLVDLIKREVDITATLRHDDQEGAIAIDFDCYGRMITAGGSIVKIWEDLTELQIADSDDEDEDEEDGSESDDDDDDDDGDDDDEEEGDDSSDNGKAAKNKKKRAREESSDDSDDSDDDSADERERERQEKQRKRREAIAARLGPMGAHGVLKFDGLD
ncbi:unnamed protein product [Parascedosporium putredinis]|uniref:WD repeat-containing protein JIP5 n=1 Tax=Parascedosporium putredinis TaxID=1442378 RepID=A0A9P1H201_9PEZI|nr:unnamed protein product [Parascedosporium putredinis]CAI7994268.1 unnamed protein product [Parascedosporium putredinis]